MLTVYEIMAVTPPDRYLNGSFSDGHVLCALDTLCLGMIWIILTTGDYRSQHNFLPYKTIL